MCKTTNKRSRHRSRDEEDQKTTSPPTSPDSTNASIESKDDDPVRESDNHHQPPREYNPRSSGYLFIGIMSLSNMFSLIGTHDTYTGRSSPNIAFGALSFSVSILIILFDRIAYLNRLFDLKNAGCGEEKYAEGFVLVGFAIFWTMGVGCMTQVDGIAYEAMNIYFITWGCLYAAIYTLNQWGRDKDIISVEELVRISKTMSGWYVLFVTSLVQMFTSMNMATVLDRNENMNKYRAQIAWAIVSSFISTVVSIIAISVHYKLIRCCNMRPGGTLEITVSIIMILMWTICVGTLTQKDDIAATIVGSSCKDDTNVPGSNLYLGTWLGFFSSIWIAMKWKESRALRFAQTEEELFSPVAVRSKGVKTVDSIKVGGKLTVVPEDIEV